MTFQMPPEAPFYNIVLTWPFVDFAPSGSRSSVFSRLGADGGSNSPVTVAGGGGDRGANPQIMVTGLGKVVMKTSNVNAQVCGVYVSITSF